MNKTPALLGFLQALALAAYVALFSSIVQTLGPWVEANIGEPNHTLSMSTFLLAFVTSALICSSFAFLFPVRLFLLGERERAIRTVVYTALWLLLFIVLAILAVILT